MSVVLFITALLAADPAQQIAYISVDADGATTLQRVNTETNSSTLIAENPALEPPAWSPDGAQIAWVDAATGAVQITSADDPAATPRRLSGATASHPRWFADGSMLAATVQPSPEAPPSIVVHDLEQGTQETWGGEMGRSIGGLVIQGLMQAEWLPSGRLVLALDPEAKLDVESVDMNTLRIEGGITEEALREDLPPRALLALALVIAHGRLSTEPVLVTRTQVLPILLLPVFDDAGASLRFAEWNIVPNSNGDRVALESNLGGDREILAISRIGLTNISNHHAADQNPVWGDDRRVLLFESFRGSRRGVYHAIADTARVKPIAASEDFDAWSPAWSSDGDAIAYISNATGTPELYVANDAGENAAQCTQHPDGGMALAPVWRPEAD